MLGVAPVTEVLLWRGSDKGLALTASVMARKRVTKCHRNVIATSADPPETSESGWRPLTWWALS